LVVISGLLVSKNANALAIGGKIFRKNSCLWTRLHMDGRSPHQQFSLNPRFVRQIINLSREPNQIFFLKRKMLGFV
jgi:hypothetical protein